ncbi:hypothetical protein AGABI2DRAFT_123531 [Agaricus bisporus var. bisporus H97]|uniref:hypothetical protein n=1 Tax=Agaricus bisporus var. bisporus (strain H97 / ATCC MYA-4626 / FGSC 10389) TaxID=936046 RepID=UPI00029F5E02|nr:hypothetical protein AGABI2DRAFT_123531 [Agaricus bisporus var. bisporus H97]EKV41616.1 hypothetical protein AGABI2DRAFT_123531 [Agaricus bisporus var. bisporus H97]
MVERPPPRPILDDFGMESILGQGANVDLVDPFSVAPGSPALHSVGGTPTSFNHAHAGMHSPTTSTTTMDQGQGQKSPLGTSTRPYVPRRSSNSIMGVMASPALSGSNNNNDNDNNNNGIQASSSSSSSSSTLAAPVMSSGESPNLLSQVPTFVKRKKSTDGDYFSSAT